MNNRFPLPVAAVMVDLDGTLLDTIHDLANAANDMLREMGYAPLPVETEKSFVGKGLHNLIRRCLAAAAGGEPGAALFERAVPVYEEAYLADLAVHTRPFPGVVEGLDALRGAGFPLACVTNKAGRFTRPLLEHTGLAPYFQLVLAGDTLPRKKPDPLPLLHASRHFGVEPRELLLIGDSLNDAQAARAAGCPVFCVPYGYNEGADVRSLDCDAIVGSLLEASALIRKVQP
jgi:phosphoglycolate phosphatase